MIGFIIQYRRWIGLALAVLALAGLYYSWSSTISERNRLRAEAIEHQAQIKGLLDHVEKLHAINKKSNTLKKEIANAPDHNGCPDPSILRGAVKRLHSGQ